AGLVSASGGFEFKCTEESGALLALNDAAHKNFLDCGEQIVAYMKRHLQSWYRWAKVDRGISLEAKDIIFVSGFTKTSSWTVAAFQGSTAHS
uniref:hypothetical protein n=1 Tax=Escherichia coli TaxID=562 RepID=UPI0019643BF0